MNHDGVFQITVSGEQSAGNGEQLREFLDSIKFKLQSDDSNEKGGDQIRLFNAVRQCEYALTACDLAQACEAFLNLGLCLSAYDRKFFFDDVFRRNKIKGIPKLAKQRNEKSCRNEEIRENFARIIADGQNSPADAKRKLGKEYELKPDTIAKIVK